MTKRTVDTAEGRARLARPSLCLLAVVSALAIPGALAPAAQAVKPPTPALTGTNPASSEFVPASETEPLVFGEGEPGEGHTSKVDGSAVLGLGGPLIKVTKHPEYEIELYSGSLPCTGPAIAEGLASKLESTGFRVKVFQDSITTFYARQIDLSDPGSPSDCSPGKTYWEGAVAVPPPGGGSGDGSPGGAPGRRLLRRSTGSRPDPPRLRVPRERSQTTTPPWSPAPLRTRRR